MRGTYLQIVRWENFLDAMSDTRLQDEYNEALRSCDIFVGLFFTKVGKFTEEEFEVAYGAFKGRRRPRIYTYFKDADVKTGALSYEFLSLLDFKTRLLNLGHFPSNYSSIEDLKRQFRDQLDGFLDDDRME